MTSDTHYIISNTRLRLHNGVNTIIDAQRPDLDVIKISDRTKSMSAMDLAKPPPFLRKAAGLLLAGISCRLRNHPERKEASI